jgi:hypothetical protein
MNGGAIPAPELSSPGASAGHGVASRAVRRQQPLLEQRKASSERTSSVAVIGVSACFPPGAFGPRTALVRSDGASGGYAAKDSRAELGTGTLASSASPVEVAGSSCELF